jgi:hypothetical protein
VVLSDQGYTDDQPGQDAVTHGMPLEIVKLEAKNGFVLLPRRWMVEHSVARMARVRRVARDSERLPAILAGFHVLAFASLLLKRFVENMAQRA